LVTLVQAEIQTLHHVADAQGLLPRWKSDAHNGLQTWQLDPKSTYPYGLVNAEYSSVLCILPFFY
jgi:hypothetical protein